MAGNVNGAVKREETHRTDRDDFEEHDRENAKDGERGKTSG